MKKERLFVALSSTVLAFSFAFCAACNTEVPPGPPTKHEHTYSEEWSRESEHHWNAATCEHTEETTNYGEHEYDENGFCTVCGYCMPTPEEPPVLSGGYEGTVGEITFTLPDLGEAVRLHTEAQAQFMKAKGYGNAIFDYAKGQEELSHPVPVSFTWEAEGAAEDATYTLNVSESEDMSDPWTFATTELSFEVYNLKIGTTYFWTVTAGDVTSGAAIFTTEATGPRNLCVDGVTNVRDVGGWTIEGGKTVKQGLLFRTGRLNESYSGVRSITEQGMDTMLNTLKVKTEIDLRGGKNDPDEYAPGVNKSVLEGVAYHHIGMNWDGDMWELNPKEIREVFSLLADENNYPMFYHCSIGTDRTGIITYLVLGLLGVPEESIFRD